MTYRFWRNAAIAVTLMTSLVLAGTALAAETTALPGQGKNQDAGKGLHKGWIQGKHLGWRKSQPQWSLRTQEQRSLIQAAIRNGDYAAWDKLVAINGQRPSRLQVITADNFAKYADMMEARWKGDWKTAQQIAEQLGLKGMGKKLGAKHGLGKGLGRLAK